MSDKSLRPFLTFGIDRKELVHPECCFLEGNENLSANSALIVDYYYYYICKQRIMIDI